MRKPPARAPGTGLAAVQRAFDELAESGAGRDDLERFIVDVFVERNRTIRDADFRLLNPATVAEDYLRPRRDLYCFAVVNWIRRIFVPSLRPRVAERMLVFGLGRLFSAYNDMGVQDCTDADVNVVVDDALGASDRSYLASRLKELKRDLYDRFALVLDLDPSYTLLRSKDVIGRLRSRDARIREPALRFYKSNERSIAIIKDNEALREGVFSVARSEPDSRLFENFLGLRGGAGYAALRSGAETLPILVEGGERALVGTLVGSRTFDEYCRRALPQGRFLSPPDWTFSMKYFVNRAYDYVGAMRGIGRTLEEIGFDAPDRRTGGDPDYLYLRNAHKLMLYLQELVTLANGSYNDAMCDYSYISRARFMRFMEIHADKFRRDFDEMVLGGDLLAASAKKRYGMLRQKIKSKARDRFLEMSVQERALLPPGFACETVYRDAHRCRICVPYSWGDLGYFVFSSIASRIARIVDERLVPRLPELGMGEEDYRRHLAALGLGGE